MKAQIIKTIGMNSVAMKNGVFIPDAKLSDLATALNDMVKPADYLPEILELLQNNIDILTMVAFSHEIQELENESTAKLLILRAKFNQDLLNKLKGIKV